MSMKLLPNKNSPLSELTPFGKIQYVVTDIDGTLVQGFDSVFERIASSVAYLKTQKIIFSIATGRSLNGARPVIDAINLSVGTPIILYNGTVIIRHKTKEIVYSNNIPQFASQAIKIMTEKYPLSAYVAYFNEDIYYNHRGIITPECETVYGWGIKCRETDYNGLPIIWNRAEEPLIPTTIVLECHDKIKLSDIINSLKQISGITVTTSGTGYIEIAPKPCNKGSALQTIRRVCSWPYESVLCIGDNDNDVSLLSSADIGVAVSNASAEAKKAADYICEFPNVQGVVDVCDILISAKRFAGD